jgi:hypothetical protein
MSSLDALQAKGIAIAPLALEPLGRLSIVLADPLILRGTPSGTRVIVDWLDISLLGPRMRAHRVGSGSCDWVTFGPEGTATLDMRFTLRTDDGAVLYVQGIGRADVSNGPGSAPSYCAFRFETDDARYGWLNRLHAVSKGVLDGGDGFVADLYALG